MHSSNSKIKISFIIAAAGSGTRMKNSSNIKTPPKQFIEYKGEPLIYSTIIVAENCEYVDEIIIVTNKEYLKFLKEYCIDKKFKKIKAIVSGGQTRQESIYNTLEYINKDNIVAVHDAARPFLKEESIINAMEVFKNSPKYDGVILGVKSRDTIKIIDINNEVISTPKRENLILVQTPQFFKRNIFEKAYEQAKIDNFIGTDDSSLVERVNGEIKFIEGSYNNIKITVKEDLKYLREEE